MTEYDLVRLKQEVDALPTPASSNTAKGRRLQNLAEYVLSRIPGCTIEGRNEWNAARSQEVDLWAVHNPSTSGLLLEMAFPVECKNEESPVSAPEIVVFANKIAASGGHDGLLVGAAGVSGSATTGGVHEISVQLSRGIRIHAISAIQIAGLTTTDDTVRLLREIHLKLRMKQMHP